MCNYHLCFLFIYHCRIYCFLLMYLLCTFRDTNGNIPESQSRSTRQLRHSLSLLGVGFWFPVLHLKRSLGLCLAPPISCLSSPFPYLPKIIEGCRHQGRCGNSDLQSEEVRAEKGKASGGPVSTGRLTRWCRNPGRFPAEAPPI
jgi:hypothetical protein